MCMRSTSVSGTASSDSRLCIRPSGWGGGGGGGEGDGVCVCVCVWRTSTLCSSAVAVGLPVTQRETRWRLSCLESAQHDKITEVS